MGFAAGFRVGYDSVKDAMQRRAYKKGMEELKNEEIKAEFDAAKFNESMGLNAESDTGAMMRDRVSGTDDEFTQAYNQATAEALASNPNLSDEQRASIDTTAGAGRGLSYSYMGEKFDQRPDRFQQADVYGRKEAAMLSGLGMYEEAAKARQRSFDAGSQGLKYEMDKEAHTSQMATNRLNQQMAQIKIDAAEESSKNQKLINGVNQRYHRLYTGKATAEDMDATYAGIAKEFNGSNLMDNDERLEKVDGEWALTDKKGNVLSPMATFIEKLPSGMKDMYFGLGHQYELASITGKYEEVNKIVKNYKDAMNDALKAQNTGRGAGFTGSASDLHYKWQGKVTDAQEKLTKANEAAELIRWELNKSDGEPNAEQQAILNDAANALATYQHAVQNRDYYAELSGGGLQRTGNSQFTVGKIYTNPKTGEKGKWDGEKMVPIK